MEKYTIAADSVVNLYKSEDSVRRSEVLLIGQDYLIDDCLPDMSAEDYDSYRTKVYLAEVPDKPLGWVNYKDFINAALKSVAPSDLVEETELEQKDMTTDKVSIWLEEYEETEEVVYPTVRIKKGITFDYDNKSTGYLPNEYSLLKEENNIAYVRNKASQQTFRFASNALDR